MKLLQHLSLSQQTLNFSCRLQPVTPTFAVRQRLHGGTVAVLQLPPRQHRHACESSRTHPPPPHPCFPPLSPHRGYAKRGFKAFRVHSCAHMCIQSISLPVPNSQPHQSLSAWMIVATAPGPVSLAVVSAHGQTSHTILAARFAGCSAFCSFAEAIHMLFFKPETIK